MILSKNDVEYYIQTINTNSKSKYSAPNNVKLQILIRIPQVEFGKFSTRSNISQKF